MKVEAYCNGYKVVGTIISGDWEGDPSAGASFVRTLPDYVEDMGVFEDGSDVDIYGDLDESELEECREALLEEVKS